MHCVVVSSPYKQSYLHDKAAHVIVLSFPQITVPDEGQGTTETHAPGLWDVTVAPTFICSICHLNKVLTAMTAAAGTPIHSSDNIVLLAEHVRTWRGLVARSSTMYMMWHSAASMDLRHHIEIKILPVLFVCHETIASHGLMAGTINCVVSWTALLGFGDPPRSTGRTADDLQRMRAWDLKLDEHAPPHCLRSEVSRVQLQPGTASSTAEGFRCTRQIVSGRKAQKVRRVRGDGFAVCIRCQSSAV